MVVKDFHVVDVKKCRERSRECNEMELGGEYKVYTREGEQLYICIGRDEFDYAVTIRLSEYDNMFSQSEEDEVIIDPETGDAVDFDGNNNQHTTYRPTVITGGVIEEQPRKVYVAGIDVSVLNERVQHLDGNGKLIFESLKDYTRKSILSEFRSLEEFLTLWNKADKKKAIIDELESHGIILENLREEVKKDLDIFDLICHVAWDMPALTRRERADQVKKRNYFTKYGEKARMVLNALLDKYATEGIENIEELSVLKVEPFPDLGTPAEGCEARPALRSSGRGCTGQLLHPGLSGGASGRARPRAAPVPCRSDRGSVSAAAGLRPGRRENPPSHPPRGWGW